ncbi:hypothetical protein ABVT39_005021 [Epinephelus coioides]
MESGASLSDTPDSNTLFPPCSSCSSVQLRAVKTRQCDPGHTHLSSAGSCVVRRGPTGPVPLPENPHRVQRDTNDPHREPHNRSDRDPAPPRSARRREAFLTLNSGRAAAWLLGREENRQPAAAAWLLGREENRQPAAAAWLLGREENRQPAAAAWLLGREENRQPAAAAWLLGREENQQPAAAAWLLGREENQQPAAAAWLLGRKRTDNLQLLPGF